MSRFEHCCKLLQREQRTVLFVSAAVLAYIIVGATAFPSSIVARATWFLTIPSLAIWISGGVAVVRSREQHNLELSRALASAGEKQAARLTRMNTIARSLLRFTRRGRQLQEDAAEGQTKIKDIAAQIDFGRSLLDPYRENTAMKLFGSDFTRISTIVAWGSLRECSQSML